MARIFPSPMQRPGIELMSVQLHLSRGTIIEDTLPTELPRPRQVLNLLTLSCPKQHNKAFILELVVFQLHEGHVFKDTLVRRQKGREKGLAPRRVQTHQHWIIRHSFYRCVAAAAVSGAQVEFSSCREANPGSFHFYLLSLSRAAPSTTLLLSPSEFPNSDSINLPLHASLWWNCWILSGFEPGTAS